MLTCRHISASGPLDEGWEFRRGHIEATVRRGATLIHLWIEVCSAVRPRFGAAPIVRLDGEGWIVLPVRFERTWPGGIETLTGSHCPVGDLLDPGEQLALTNCPERVSAELEAL